MVLCVILLVAGYTLIGKTMFPEKKDIYYADFTDAGGVKGGAVITMAGVSIGRVVRVKLISPTQARMELAINLGTFLPDDAVLSVPTSLFAIGEQKVEITSKKGPEAMRLEPGSVMRGQKSTALGGMMPEASGTLTELTETLKALREVIGDKSLKNRLENILISTDKTIQQVGLLMQDTRSFIVQNKGLLAATLKNASYAVDDLRKGIKSVSAIVGDPKMKDEVMAMLSTLNATAKKAEEMVATLSATVTDPRLREAIDGTMQNVAEMTKTGTKIAANAEQITANGSVVSAKAIELTDQAKEIAAETKKLLEKLNQFADKLPGTSFGVPKIGFELDSGINTETDKIQTNVGVKVPISSKGSIHAGLYDATEGKRLTLQYGQKFGTGTLRYGIFASKPGVGVDYDPFPGLSLSGDWFDPNNSQFNVRAKWLFGSSWYGFVGMNDLFDKNQPLLGLGIRR